MLFYLNQLNGYQCFQNCCPTNVPDCVISSFDGRFNCNPDGCDTFKYDSYKNDTLYCVQLKDCAQSLIDITPSRTKKPKYKGFRERHLFRYNIHEYRKSVRFMNYDFHNSIPIPDNHFAVPYSTDTVSCNHNRISYRQFAYLKKKDINLLMKK